MTRLSRALRTQCRKALFAGLALSVLLTPTRALSAEREGTVLFFSVEDLHQVRFPPRAPLARAPVAQRRVVGTAQGGGAGRPPGAQFPLGQRSGGRWVYSPGDPPPVG